MNATTSKRRQGRALGRSSLLLIGLAAGACPALTARDALAQPSIDVAALVKLVDEQPADMDRALWKEKRREAAKRLGTIRDKRAVAALSKLAETETFDIIGEIAIQGLGQLADPAAIPVLQRIAADPAREKAQRDLAKKTLAKLGASDSSGSSGSGSSGSGSSGSGSSGSSGSGSSGSGSGSSGSGSSGGSGPRHPPGGSGSGSGGRPAGSGASDGAGGATGAGATTDPAGGGDATAPSEDVPPASAAILGDSEEVPAGPTWAPEVLAATEHLTLAAGSARFDYDTVRKRPSFDGDVAASYRRRIEEQRRALGFGGDARLIAGYVNPDGDGSNRGAVISTTASGEARFYSGAFYGIGQAIGRLQLTYLSIDRADPNADDTKDVRTSADLEIALGGGWGRVLDVGAQLRVRRLAQALEKNRALGRPIDAEVSRQLQSAWWALRGTTSAHRLLTTTVAILRKAGVLLGEPDAGLTYELLAVLRDGQLVDRQSGLDVWLGFGEGYLLREDVPGVASGRVEQALARARFGQQAQDGKSDLSATGFARLALFTGDAPAPWALGASARVRRFAYGEHGDAIGALDLSAEVALSSDDLDDSNVGLRLGGEVGFSWVMNLASSMRVAGRVVDDAGELSIMGLVEARYGLLDGAFATAP
jgi:hypothetical protein